jgi:hypothetical protein
MPDMMSDVLEPGQAMFNPSGLQHALYDHVVGPYKKENKLRTIGLHIKGSGDVKGPVVVYTQMWLGTFTIGKEKPVIEIRHPYYSSNVTILDPKYQELGQKVKSYIDRIMDWQKDWQKRLSDERRGKGAGAEL